MTFKIHKIKNIVHRKKKPAGINFGMLKRGEAPAKSFLTFPTDIVDEMGFGDRDAFHLHVGENEDFGKIVLEHVDTDDHEGLAVLNFQDIKRATWFRMNLGHIESFPNVQMMSALCKYKKVDNTIRIVLPLMPKVTTPKFAAPKSKADIIKEAAASFPGAMKNKC